VIFSDSPPLAAWLSSSLRARGHRALAVDIRAPGALEKIGGANVVACGSDAVAVAAAAMLAGEGGAVVAVVREEEAGRRVAELCGGRGVAVVQSAVNEELFREARGRFC
jgi:hypothetical protein